jgi:protoporphyrinogen oxidase
MWWLWVLVWEAFVLLRFWRTMATKSFLAEGQETLGGRVATVEKEGFKFGTGALVFHGKSGPLKEVFDEVGVPFDVQLIGAPYIWIDGKWYSLPERGQISAMFSFHFGQD